MWFDADALDASRCGNSGKRARGLADSTLGRRVPRRSLAYGCVQSTKVRGKMPMGRHACGCLAGQERSANRSRKDREEGQRIDDREGVPVSNEYVSNERLSYDARLPSASTRRPPTAPFLALFAAVTVTPPPSRERVLNMASLTHCSFFSLADTGAAFGF